ncbi:MAG TPA: T9SS type A sorting domain-containing protein, partial [Rhodothermales bacterium]|nr:T9SS type A sorting domain-containing protein [Rhodothermales bacterium]
GVYQQRYTLQAATAEARTAEGWRLLAAPTAAATVNDLLGPVWTQGFPGADYNGAAPVAAPNVYRYDETTAGGLAAGYTAPTSAAEVMGSGRGYFAYLYVDDNQYTPTLDRGFPKVLYVLHDVGAAPEGPVALPVSYTDTADPELEDGWNLVGNPYRQSIDWDLATRADVASSAYVYDPALPGYRVWNGVAGNLADGVVAPLQGFWVKAMDTDANSTVTPSASLPSTAQVAGGTFYGRAGEGAAAPVLALSLTREAGGYGRTAEAFVSFEAGAAAGLDAADAYHLDPAAGDYTALFTRATDGTALVIQALPESGPHTFPLEVAALEGGAPVGGAFTLSWAAPALPPGATARLLDAVTGASVDLTAAGTYTFTLDAPAGRGVAPATPAALAPPAPRVLDGTSDGLTSGRFTVVVNGATTGTEAGASALALSVAPNPVLGSGVVRYVLPEASRVRVSVYDVLGREVAVLMDGEQGAGRYDVALDAARLAPGAYLVRLTAGEATLVRRVTVAR